MGNDSRPEGSREIDEQDQINRGSMRTGHSSIDVTVTQGIWSIGGFLHVILGGLWCVCEECG